MQRCDAETRRWEAMLLLDSVDYVCAGWEVRVRPRCGVLASARAHAWPLQQTVLSAIEDAFGLDQFYTLTPDANPRHHHLFRQGAVFNTCQGGCSMQAEAVTHASQWVRREQYQ